MILRRQDIMNNNGITTSHKRDKTNDNIKMPPIGNRQSTNEQVSVKQKFLELWLILLNNRVCSQRKYL